MECTWQQWPGELWLEADEAERGLKGGCSSPSQLLAYAVLTQLRVITKALYCEFNHCYYKLMI